MFPSYEESLTDSLNAFQKHVFEAVQNMVDVQTVDNVNTEASHVEVVHSGNKTELCIFLSAKTSDAFINLYVSIEEIILFLSGWHEHFLSTEKSINETIAAASGLIEKYLKGDIKIVEIRSNDKPYKWLLYEWNINNWIWKSTSSVLCIFSFFGKKAKSDLVFAIRR